MQLSSRQIRVFKLAILLSTGKKVPTIKIISALECSEPTLTRVLKEIRSLIVLKLSTVNHPDRIK